SDSAPLKRIKDAQALLSEDIIEKEGWVRGEDGLLRDDDKKTLVIPEEGTLRRELFDLTHTGAFGGHKGRDAVLRTFKSWKLGWKGMKKDISRWIGECLICQRDRLSLDSFRGGGTTFVEKPFHCIAIDTM
ncbi:hypothetical protein ADUPG1_003985, partial [Aduncisulcus paluster]